ncbi:hypothetical protein P154DRAFT_449501 [Amniculicola lignicola CBS 123094]|uniref:mRNA decay factor PAT1 domain-containing protein n=1 Tax=Amniculicola lignicola CBS 123094 TaxID=1392246 RepID=A0A6A5VY92_9PLEO|nr:hypothetical protein P154DRAFT_449501 [Amniculicola lignicola CBS 123094]
MSFFGFDPAGPSKNRPGFGQTVDAWAGLGGAPAEDDALDFEETYDGLGDRLDETDDAFNDETFGGMPSTRQGVGTDFDFAGQTSQISNTIHEEQMIYQAQQRPVHQRPQVQQAAKPARTGYEAYKDPNFIPQLEVRNDIWGLKPKESAPARQPEPENRAPQTQPKKVLSIEEVEARMRESQGRPPAQPTYDAPPPMQLQQQMPHGHAPYPGMQAPFMPQILQRPQQPPHQPQPPPQQQQVPQQPPQQYPQGARQPPQPRAELHGHAVSAPPPQQQQPTILQRQRPVSNDQQQQRQGPPQQQAQRPPSQPRQILQNPNRLSGHGQPMTQTGPRGSAPAHSRGPSFPGMVITHPEQLLQLSETERATFLEEDAKRAKRNHKIALLARDNGLMTPQDKNFITRIQLQQLMTATGNLEDLGPEAAIAEDFYYQVFSQIRGAPRQTPHQPANQFAQTYLFQTSSRYGPGRRNGRGGDNHLQRMEQQVQRAVEAAKAKPKGKQLVFEGSLGKIAFSNSKTPRPLLSIKRPDLPAKPSKVHEGSITDRKETLRNIEIVYMTLMEMEDHARSIPPPITEESDPEAIQKHMEWRTMIDELHAKLWQDIKIMEPIIPNADPPHPFIAMLAYAKGKKSIPRIFRHIDENERITVVTMIIVHLDQISVIRHGTASPEEPLTPAMREEIELFSLSVMPPLFAHISESPLNIIIGLLGLIIDRTNVQLVARTKIGMSVLSILVSRAEILKQSAPEIDPTDWENWNALYNRLFDTVEPVLPYLFPGTAHDADDMYVWQFLAAMGVGASPEQQQRLVLGVKDRVMETVAVSKALPAEMAASRLSNVNLFMRAIGLDVELLG